MQIRSRHQAETQQEPDPVLHAQANQTPHAVLHHCLANLHLLNTFDRTMYCFRRAGQYDCNFSLPIMCSFQNVVRQSSSQQARATGSLAVRHSSSVKM